MNKPPPDGGPKRLVEVGAFCPKRLDDGPAFVLGPEDGSAQFTAT